MKDKQLTMTLLFDYYGELLTEKQKICFDLYYNQDFSLAEIAQECGISRQGVHDSLVRAEAALLAMEEKTGCVARDKGLSKALDVIFACTQALSGHSDAQVQQLAARIQAAAQSLKE